MYCVVETYDLKNEKEVCVASEKWIQNNSLWWPPKHYNLNKALKNHVAIQTDWSQQKCIVLESNISKKIVILHVYSFYTI